MPKILLIFLLLLSSSNSRGARVDKAAHPNASQSEAGFLNPVLDEVDAVKDPSARVFLRFKIAAYLWNHPYASARSARSIAEAAKDDLLAHENEIPKLYADLFRRELLAQLNTHDTNAKGTGGETARLESRSGIEVAYSMLGQDGGADSAVAMVRNDIATGKDPGPAIIFFLRRLDKVKAVAVPDVLDTLISVEESHPGFIPAASLFTLQHLYVREQTPRALQIRYIYALLRRAGETEPGGDSVVDIYNALANAMPAIEKRAPERYDAASAQLSQLTGQMPAETLERLSVDKRISQSTNPLAQLLVEADAAKDQTLRGDLLTRAAQLSLEKGQPRDAVDLVLKLQTKTSEARLWRDQFVEDVVTRSLEKADVESARYGTDRIEATSTRVSALQKIALHLLASGDGAGARGTLNAALTVINASEDKADKAAELLDLVVSYSKVDGQLASEVARAAVNVINKTPVVLRKEKDACSADVDDMMKLSYSLIPAFQALGATDRVWTEGLADKIQRQELKIVATFAVLTSQQAAIGNQREMASQ